MQNLFTTLNFLYQDCNAGVHCLIMLYLFSLGLCNTILGGNVADDNCRNFPSVSVQKCLLASLVNHILRGCLK